MLKKLLACLLLIVGFEVTNGRICVRDLNDFDRPEDAIRGVTFLNSPFVERDNATGELRGFFVDFLNEMSRIGGFKYTLKILGNPNDGKPDKKQWEKLFEENNGESEFAITETGYWSDAYRDHIESDLPYCDMTELSLPISRDLRWRLAMASNYKYRRFLVETINYVFYHGNSKFEEILRRYWNRKCDVKKPEVETSSKTPANS